MCPFPQCGHQLKWLWAPLVESWRPSLCTAVVLQGPLLATQPALPSVCSWPEDRVQVGAERGVDLVLPCQPPARPALSFCPLLSASAASVLPGAHCDLLAVSTLPVSQAPLAGAPSHSNV